MVPDRKLVKQNFQPENKKTCQVKKERINRTPVAENQYMDFVDVCRMPTDVKCWPAAERKDVISLQFLTSTVQKNKTGQPDKTYMPQENPGAFFIWKALTCL
jgi:hypothetical protein